MTAFTTRSLGRISSFNFISAGHRCSFIKFVKDQLLELGVSDDRIHYEVFGPHQQL